MHDFATLAALGVFPVLMLAAALCDIATLTIPNRLSIALTPAFFLAAWLAGLSTEAVAWHAATGAAALAIAAGGFALGLMGGGDAKLLAVAALWLGPTGALPLLTWTALAGGGLAAVLLLGRRLPQAATAGAPAWAGRLLQPRGGVPYGVAIAAGALIALPRSGLLVGFGGGA